MYLFRRQDVTVDLISVLGLVIFLDSFLVAVSKIKPQKWLRLE